ncbi:MAG: HEAT repeat domain-containing protein [Planctomycetes bacterium]|nr:HEAT repeat domain-containing protein [Planctomycetota bacterium]
MKHGGSGTIWPLVPPARLLLLAVLGCACRGTAPEATPPDVATPAPPTVGSETGPAPTAAPAPSPPRTDALDLLEKAAGLDSPLKRKIGRWDAQIEKTLAEQAAARRRGGKEALEELLAGLEACAAGGELDPVGHYLQGRLLGKLDRLEAARAAFGRSLELDPDFLYGYEGQAKCAQDEEGRLDLEAVERLTDRAFRIWGEFPRGWLVRGQAHAVHAQLDEALAAFSRVPVQHPAAPEAAVGAAECHRRRGQLDLARASLRRALEAHPDEPALDLHLGIVLLEEGNTDQARAAFVRVLAAEPDQPDARQGLAVVKARRGDLAGAAEDLLALSRDPALPRHYRRAALQQLSQLEAAARGAGIGPQLLERLDKSPDPAQRREAASVLYRVHDKAVLLVFLRKLDREMEPDEAVRVFAVKAIGSAGLPEDLPMLLVRLLDPAAEPSRLVRGAAANALGRVPLEHAPLAELVQALADPDDYVFGQVRAALQRITGQRLGPLPGDVPSAQERAQVLAAWRNWLAEPPGPAAPPRE